MRVAAISTVICILFILGCGKSQPPQPSGAQNAPGNDNTATAPGGSAGAASETSLLIRPGQGVGELRFGMSQAEMEDVLGKPERTTAGASEYMSKGIAVLPGKDSAVGAIMCGDMNDPNSPLVKACKYRTGKGIGMGSGIEEIRTAYGEPSSVKQMGGRQMVSYKMLGATFTLNNNKVIHMTFRHP